MQVGSTKIQWFAIVVMLSIEKLIVNQNQFTVKCAEQYQGIHNISNTQTHCMPIPNVC